MIDFVLLVRDAFSFTGPSRESPDRESVVDNTPSSRFDDDHSEMCKTKAEGHNLSMDVLRVREKRVLESSDDYNVAKRLNEDPVFRFFASPIEDGMLSSAECLYCRKKIVLVGDSDEDLKEAYLHIRDKHQEYYPEVNFFDLPCLKCICLLIFCNCWIGIVELGVVLLILII